MERFEIVLDGYGVLDKETGLVWIKSPPTSESPWINAWVGCLANWTGGRYGWRLPTLNELHTLIDPTQTDPALPAGHPFTGIQIGLSSGYWTSTNYPDAAIAQTYIVEFFGDGGQSLSPKSTSSGRHYWCVRGGQGQ